MQSRKEEEGKVEQKGSKKRAEINEQKREKWGANNSREGCKKKKKEVEKSGKRGQPTKGKVGCKKVKNGAAN